MEWIVISPSKLKIMLRQEDMKRYDLCMDRLDSADEQTRHTFRQIFEEVRCHTGFDTAGERLFVQLYTSRDGGCEIFVTKLGASDGDDGLPPSPSELELKSELEAESEADTALACPSPEDALLHRLFPNAAERTESSPERAPAAPSSQPHRTLAFGFDGLEPLLQVCRRLRQTAELGHPPAVQSATVYIDTSSSATPYYLFLGVPDRDFFRLPDAYAFLSEYGERVSPKRLSLYLSEHGKILCHDTAVQVLGAL